MVFSSPIFIFYFLPLFFTLYYCTPKRFKNAVILLSSIIFYAWGAPKFLFVILGTTALDFLLVKRMDAAHKKWQRKILLCASLSLNIGLLAYFKYSNFFIENVNQILQPIGLKPIKWFDILLPIGISFYTFESLTYVVDVYRKVHAPLKRFWDYQLYIIFFPKLIAGPIVRYHDIADQIYDRSAHSDIDHRLRGFYRFCIGLGKKVLIANYMGGCADALFNTPTEYLTTADAWIGALSYTFQIYFDFSGYSDMAIGLALMMGFRLPENFNNPYTALSVTDFWRKWHITLGAWMRNYLYIPLGGNKVASKTRLYFNLWVVFLASGLWHGASWGFIFWGAYHGFFLVAERLFLEKWLRKAGKFAAIYTFFVVLIGWVFFRIEHFLPSVRYIEKMFQFQSAFSAYWNVKYMTMLAIAAFFSFFILLPFGKRIEDRVFNQKYTLAKHAIMATVTLILFILSSGYLISSDFNPFIYFRF